MSEQLVSTILEILASPGVACCFVFLAMPFKPFLKERNSLQRRAPGFGFRLGG
jgi:hypothetical protein